MNLLTIAWKGLKQRKLASALTAFSIALGTMLMVAVIVLAGAVDGVFNQQSIGYNLIVGAKGSALQLVMSTVYRIQPPIANLPLMYLQQLQDDPRVELAIPMAFGDFTKPEHGSFPIVGTTTEYFLNEYAPGKTFQIQDQSGSRQLTKLYDSVIGSQVALRNNWKVGDTFSIVHGSADSETVHDEMFEIVAVLQQTGTPNDRSVFLNLEAMYILDGHQKPVDEVEVRLRDFYGDDEARLTKALWQLNQLRKERAAGEAEGDPERGWGIDTPEAMKEVTAILVNMRSDFDAVRFQSQLKSTSKAMAVNPIRPIKQLMTQFVGPTKDLLMVLIAMIILVSGVSIFVSIYNSMSDRKREIGIMRALGAQRNSVFAIILAEAAVLCVGGGLLGWIAGHTVAVVASPWISVWTGLLLNPWYFNPYEFVLFPCLLLLGVLVGFLPAMTAYRTNVADALQG